MEQNAAAASEPLVADAGYAMVPTIEQLTTQGLALWGGRMGRAMLLEGIETCPGHEHPEYCDTHLVGVTLHADGTLLQAMVSLPAGAITAMTSLDRAEAAHSCHLMTFCVDAAVFEVPVAYLALFASEMSRLVESCPRNALVYFYDQDDGTAVPSLVELGANAPFLPGHDLDVMLHLGAAVEIYFQGQIVCEDWITAGEELEEVLENELRAAGLGGAQRPAELPLAAPAPLINLEGLSGPMSAALPTPFGMAPRMAPPGLGLGSASPQRTPGPFPIMPSTTPGLRGRGRGRAPALRAGPAASRRQASIPPPSMGQRLRAGISSAATRIMSPQPGPTASSDLGRISQQLQDLMAMRVQDQQQIHLLQTRLDHSDRQSTLAVNSAGLTSGAPGRVTFAPSTHPGAAGGRSIAPTPSHVQAGYLDAMTQARQALGLTAGALPSALAVPPPARHGRARLSDTELSNAIVQGGEQATQAIQLETLAVLSELRQGRKARGDEGDLDNLLEHDFDDSGEMKSLGAKGSSGMAKLNRAIDKEPQKWNDYVDERARVGCGCDVTNLPWSMEEYGRRRVRWGNHLRDGEKMWVMLCSFHALHRSIPTEGLTPLALHRTALLGARVSQCLKAMERYAADSSWTLAWLSTGLQDPRPSNRMMNMGLAHPSELASQSAYLREMASLETVRYWNDGGGGKGQQQWQNQDQWRDPNPKGKDGKGKDGKGKKGKDGKPSVDAVPGVNGA